MHFSPSPQPGRFAVPRSASANAIRKAQAAFAGAAEAMGVVNEEDVQYLVNDVRCGTK